MDSDARTAESYRLQTRARSGGTNDAAGGVANGVYLRVRLGQRKILPAPDRVGATFRTRSYIQRKNPGEHAERNRFRRSELTAISSGYRSIRENGAAPWRFPSRARHHAGDLRRSKSCACRSDRKSPFVWNPISIDRAAS